MPWLYLLRKFWWAIPMLALLGVAGFYKVDAAHQKSLVAARDLTIAQINAAGTAAAAAGLKSKEDSDAKLKSALDAADILGGSLRDGVRQYQNHLRADALQAAGKPEPALGGAPAAEGATDELIGRTLAACARDAARLENAHNWSKGVGGR